MHKKFLRTLALLGTVLCFSCQISTKAMGPPAQDDPELGLESRTSLPRYDQQEDGRTGWGLDGMGTSAHGVPLRSDGGVRVCCDCCGEEDGCCERFWSWSPHGNLPREENTCRCSFRCWCHWVKEVFCHILLHACVA